MTDLRPLPHDLSAEKATIGAVLVAPEGFPVARDLVSPGDFYRAAHNTLWAALQGLDDAGQAIDLLTLKSRLVASNELEDVGGLAYVTSLVDGIPRSSNVEHYAGIVADYARKRARISAHRLAIEACYAVDGSDDLADAEAALASIDAHADSRGSLLDADGQIAALVSDLERDSAGPRIDLSLPSIDQSLDGIRPGEVLQLWARPGLGKTMVACHALCGLVSSVPVICFSLEMPAAQIVRRLARMAFNLSNHRLRQGHLDVTAYREWFSALRVDATPGLSVAQMAQRVRRLQRQGLHVRTVVIDHLGLVGGDRSMTTYDRVSTQARELKELAKRYDVAVILLVQVNRDAGGDGSRELHLGSARDSGVIEEVADYIVALRRLDRSISLPLLKREAFKDVIFAKVLKHRHGAVSDREVAYRLNPETLRLQEDPHLQAEEDDLAAIAARAGRRR